jgi:hypothetical protein
MDGCRDGCLGNHATLLDRVTTDWNRRGNEGAFERPEAALCTTRDTPPGLGRAAAGLLARGSPSLASLPGHPVARSGRRLAAYSCGGSRRFDQGEGPGLTTFPFDPLRGPMHVGRYRRGLAVSRIGRAASRLVDAAARAGRTRPPRLTSRLVRWKFTPTEMEPRAILAAAAARNAA